MVGICNVLWMFAMGMESESHSHTNQVGGTPALRASHQQPAPCTASHSTFQAAPQIWGPQWRPPAALPPALLCNALITLPDRLLTRPPAHLPARRTAAPRPPAQRPARLTADPAAPPARWTAAPRPQRHRQGRRRRGAPLIELRGTRRGARRPLGTHGGTTWVQGPSTARGRAVPPGRLGAQGGWLLLACCCTCHQ